MNDSSRVRAENRQAFRLLDLPLERARVRHVARAVLLVLVTCLLESLIGR